MNGLNTKGLIKQIKASKNSLIWSLKDGVHTITNRHWLISFNDVPKEVQVALFSIFAQFPEESTHIRNDRFSGTTLKGDPIGFESIVRGAEKGKHAMDTRFIYDMRGMKARVFRQGDVFAYVDESLLHAVDEYRGEILMSGVMTPVYFKDVNYLVLPYRMGTSPEKEIQELFSK